MSLFDNTYRAHLFVQFSIDVVLVVCMLGWHTGRVCRVLPKRIIIDAVAVIVVTSDAGARAI